MWDGAGHIVTNDHVVQGAGILAVRFASGQVLRAQIVGVAPSYDLAVLRVDNTRSLPPPLAIGVRRSQGRQYVYAIGNPFGLDQTLTTGTSSALNRRLPTSAGREISNVIQTNAAINPGNSGGPLLDSAGRVIGVNTAILSPSGTSAGIAFAIPIDAVNRVAPELIGRGYVPTPGIGIVAANEAAATRAAVDGVVILRTAPTDQPKPTEEVIQARSQQALGRNDRFAMAAVVRSRGEMAFSAKDMASVKVPTLGLIGSADANLPAMQQLPSILPTLKVVVIEGATHGGPLGVVRRPEFVENFRALTTAHKEVLSSR